MNRSAERIVIPPFDVNVAMEGLMALVEVDKDWIPSEPETALYIRPTIIATEPFLGVHASISYIFFIILSPVGSYYEKGMNPVNIYVEDVYSRSAATGGTGAAKFAGNYASSMIAGTKAKKEGFDQVLWLDSNTRKNVEEVGAMNIFFLLGDTLVTPALSGTILGGITRDSILTLAKDMGYKCEERTITIDEVIAAQEKGLLKEMFGTGTAAVVSPVGMFRYKNKDYSVDKGKIGEVTLKLYNRLCAIQRGAEADKFNWLVKL
ncbi:amino acid aminotransferase [Holotrichia oblita]|nr:amino acid aminotransferase [Holotrichia oblita]